MLKNTPSDQGVLESNSPLHVRATVVDGSGDREELVVDLAGSRVVLSDTRLEEIEEELGGDVSVTDEQAIDLKVSSVLLPTMRVTYVKHGVEKVLVVASKDVLLGESLADDGDLSVPSAHVPDESA